MRMVMDTRYRLVRPVCSWESDSPAPVMLCTSGLPVEDTPLRYDGSGRLAGRGGAQASVPGDRRASSWLRWALLG